MSSRGSYKTREYHTRQILKFLKTQETKGHSLTQQKELRNWARKQRMSPTMLHELLKNLSWIVLRAENPDGLQGVFYGLSSKWRDLLVEDIRRLEEKVLKIHELPEAEKKRQLKSLIGVTIARFTDFVPFIIDLAIKNEEEIKDLQDWLNGCFQYVLLPYLFETIKACFRDREVTAKIFRLSLTH